jgi:hypothetical protein
MTEEACEQLAQHIDRELVTQKEKHDHGGDTGNMVAIVGGERYSYGKNRIIAQRNTELERVMAEAAEASGTVFDQAYVKDTRTLAKGPLHDDKGGGVEDGSDIMCLRLRAKQPIRVNFHENKHTTGKSSRQVKEAITTRVGTAYWMTGKFQEQFKHQKQSGVGMMVSFRKTTGGQKGGTGGKRLNFAASQRKESGGGAGKKEKGKEARGRDSENRAGRARSRDDRNERKRNRKGQNDEDRSGERSRHRSRERDRKRQRRSDRGQRGTTRPTDRSNRGGGFISSPARGGRWGRGRGRGRGGRDIRDVRNVGRGGRWSPRGRARRGSGWQRGRGRGPWRGGGAGRGRGAGAGFRGRGRGHANYMKSEYRQERAGGK